MVNPCYGCPKYREYGQYLDDIILAKPMVEPVLKKSMAVNQDAPDRDDERIDLGKKWGGRPAKKKKEDVIASPSKIRTRTRSARIKTSDFGKCQMGGCVRDVHYAGGRYCKSCRDSRSYCKKVGKPIPTELTGRQKMHRDMKGEK